MDDLASLLARGKRLSPSISAIDGVVVVHRPGASTEFLSVSAAVAVANRLLDAAAEAAGQDGAEEQARIGSH